MVRAERKRASPNWEIEESSELAPCIDVKFVAPLKAFIINSLWLLLVAAPSVWIVSLRVSFVILH